MEKHTFFLRYFQKPIEFLKDPEIIVQFQNYFGVYRIEPLASNKLSNGEWPAKDQPRLNEGTCTCGKHLKDLKIASTFFKSNGVKIGQLCNHSLNGGSTLTHRRELSGSSISDMSVNSASETEDFLSDSDFDESRRKVDYVINNMFWYYLFSFGASLGYELFYASFFPFWFWNIDGAVGRRVINVWVFIMYVGQALKDIIRWSRPASPPVVQLEPGYTQEYGMPSTHAMVGAAVPFSLLYFTMFRYEYPFVVGLLIACAWCVLVCLSRLYLGMHTVLDIIGGLLLVSGLMAIALPLADTIDNFQLTNPYSPLFTISILILLAIFYPNCDRWTPARGDTTVIMGTGAGISTGSWLNYQLGIIQGPGLPPPYQILWPDYGVIGLALLRASIGILCVVATRAIFKSITYAIVCYIVKLDPNDIKTKQRITVEIPYKFITYMCIGIGVTSLSPFVFRLLNIERITMFTEV